MSDLERALAAALEALEAAEVSRERAIVAVHAPFAEHEDAEYETWVGATEDTMTAVVLSMVARDLMEEAQRQAVHLTGPEPCPTCGSRRYGNVQSAHPTDSMRIRMRDECMSCGHEGPWK